MTLTADGNFLPPLFVFKGKPNGRIIKEFKDYPDDAFYVCQPKAWMDEDVMKIWIDKVLKPYVQDVQQGICPILLLDSYRCHMMESVLGMINDLGVQVEHIPGGCTGLCQPVDVGIGKPLKNRVRQKWEDWMIDLEVGDGIKPPSRKQIAEWTVNSLESITRTIIRNSWRHGRYSYFPNEVIQKSINF